MGIFNGGSFPTSGGSITLTQADYQTLSFNGTTLTISGSNSSVDLSSLLDDTNTTNTSLVLGVDNVLTLTDSASNTVTADLSSLLDDTNTTNSTLVLNGNILELTDSDANTITADLSGLTPATPTLQEVTDAGNTTTNDITINKTAPKLILSTDTNTDSSVLEFKKDTAVDAFIQSTPSSGEFKFSAGRNATWGGDYLFVTDTYDSYRITRDLHRWYILGNEKMRITSTGAVGIGTSSPSAKLDVVGAIRSSDGVNYSEFNTSGDDTILSNSTSIGNIRIFNDGSEKMRITSAGNVGIGTSSPSAKLEVVDENNAKIIVRQSNSPNASKYAQLVLSHGSTTFGANDKTYQLVSNALVSGEANFAIQYWDGANYNERLRVTSTGQLKLNNYTSTTFDGTPTSFLGVDASGNVIKSSSVLTSTPTLQEVTDAGNTTTNSIGIGTTSPSAKLDVNGEIKSDKSANGISFSATGGASAFTAYDIYTATNGGLLRLYDEVGQTVNIDGRSSNGNSWINNGGSLGIGTSSPSVLIDAQGANTDINAISVGNGTESIRIASYLDDYTEIRSTGNIPLLIKTNGNNERMRITSTGNVGIGTSSPSAKLNVVGDASSVITEIEKSTGETLFKVQDSNNPVIISNYVGGWSTWIQNSLATGTRSGLLLDAGSSSGDWNFYARSADTNTFYMGIRGDGNVGIGTSSPSAKTHIVGGAAAGGGTALLVENGAGDDLLKVEDNSDTTVFGEFKLAGYTSTFYDDTPNKFLGVDSSGNVVKQVRTWQSGIATTTTDANGEFILGSIPSSANAVTCCQYDSAGTATVYIFVYRGKNGSNQHFFKVYDLSGNAVTSTSIGVSFTYTMYPV